MEAGTAASLYQGLSAVSSVVSAVGQFSAGANAKKAGEAEQKAYEYNATIALEKAKYEEQLSRDRYERLKGKQRSAYAKSGVDLSSGSPLLVLADTAYQEEEEAQMIRFGGESEAAMQKYYGGMVATRGKQAQTQADIGGISTFLTGLGRSSLAVTKQSYTPGYWG